MATEPQKLGGPPPTEVPLQDPPLVRVLSQIRFPPILSIRNEDKTADFQESIRSSYPYLKPEKLQNVRFSDGSDPEYNETFVWRFEDSEEEPGWRVSLGVDFVSLETSKYKSREDFLKRLEHVIKATEEAFDPAAVNRLGLRYIDRLTGDAVREISDLVEPQLLGIYSPDNGPLSSLRRAMRYAQTEAMFETEEGIIQARWAFLPSRTTYDPSALEPIEEESWILDLDMFTASREDFKTDHLNKVVTGFAERIYFVFRKMVTDEFLRYYGGNVK